MNLIGGFILVSYLGLVLVIGQWGILAVAAHVCTLLIFMRRD